ncbi:unnamed protein product [Linum tenue]|uniref:Uncharacterized protein n=1 Tax=Linum tenue TaxID=586396 RepID=A0AAV0HVP9_9ROSI|nr:unnamed protein product [Linum tenue]
MNYMVLIPEVPLLSVDRLFVRRGWSWDTALSFQFWSLGQVWPYEERNEFGFVQGLLSMMCVLCSREFKSNTTGRSAKIRHVNELSRQEVDEITKHVFRQDTV